MRCRGPVAGDLAFRVRFKAGAWASRLLPERVAAEASVWSSGWHTERGEARLVFWLGGWYRAMCKLGLHCLHEDLPGCRWTCSCGRNFMNNEELSR